MEILNLIRSRKLAFVTEIKIDGATRLVVESVLRAVIEGTTTNLKTLHVILEGQDSADAALLSRAALKVETLTVADVSSAQIEEILTRVATTGESKLKELVVSTEDMDDTGLLDLTNMDPEILTEALLKLEFNLLILRSYEQMSHLLTKINTEDLRLKRLYLIHLDISELPSAVLTGAVSRVEVLGIRGSELAPDQLEAIFTMLASQHLGGSNLKELWSDGFDLSGISPELHAGIFRLN